MISLKQNRTALMNLDVTIKAIDNLDVLINEYSKDFPGPAYVQFELNHEKIRSQIDRAVMVQALKMQRQRLVDYFETLGIEVDYEVQ